MRNLFTLLVSLCTIQIQAQKIQISMLEGTWKIEGKETYEHWDLLANNHLKGISYEMKSGLPDISEFLEINQTKKGIQYTATVIHQNNKRPILFQYQQNDSSLIFENLKHDFPQRIEYHLIDPSNLKVTLSGKNTGSISYLLIKQINKKVLSDSIQNPNYDESLALKLGGDEYGMKPYIFVILKTGTNQNTDKDFLNKCFKGHMDNIHKMAEAGQLVVAGPLSKNEAKFRGLFILQVANFEEAKKLLNEDLAIKEGIFEIELFKWYGSAALPEYLNEHDKIWKQKP